MTTIRFRRGTASAWTAADPVLAAAEPAFATDSKILKIGNGTDPWSALPAISDSALLAAAQGAVIDAQLARDESQAAADSVTASTDAQLQTLVLAGEDSLFGAALIDLIAAHGGGGGGGTNTVIRYAGSWAARSTVTSDPTVTVWFISAPGAPAPTGFVNEVDVWIRG